MSIRYGRVRSECRAGSNGRTMVASAPVRPADHSGSSAWRSLRFRKSRSLDARQDTPSVWCAPRVGRLWCFPPLFTKAYTQDGDHRFGASDRESCPQLSVFVVFCVSHPARRGCVKVPSALRVDGTFCCHNSRGGAIASIELPVTGNLVPHVFDHCWRAHRLGAC